MLDTRPIKWWVWELNHDECSHHQWYLAPEGRDIHEPFALSRGRKVHRYYGEINAEMFRALEEAISLEESYT